MRLTWTRETLFFRLFNNQITNGTVVRVRMVNFMSCGDTEMRPGPGFNVVIGPNGTGKFAHTVGVVVYLGVGRSMIHVLLVTY